MKFYYNVYLYNLKIRLEKENPKKYNRNCVFFYFFNLY